jgi:hypothetical protein
MPPSTRRPRQAHVRLTSAQATPRLPGPAVYQVSSQVKAGYVHLGIPQASRAASAVTGRISSGEPELLPPLTGALPVAIGAMAQLPGVRWRSPGRTTPRSWPGAVPRRRR